MAECAAIADSCNKVVAVGINCTPPTFITALISTIKKVFKTLILVFIWYADDMSMSQESQTVLTMSLSLFFDQATTKPILIYPNSGETYDAQRKQWVVTTTLSLFIYYFFTYLIDQMEWNDIYRKMEFQMKILFHT